MKIIFDCTVLSEWKGNPTGIQRVAIGIGGNLSIINDRIELGILSECDKWQRYSIKENKTTQEEIILESGDILLTVASNWDFPNHQKTLMSLSREGINIIPLLYDIIPLILPHSYGPGFPHIYKNWLDETLKSIDYALAISEHTKNDIKSYMHSIDVTGVDIDVIRLGDEIEKYTGAVSKKVEDFTSKEYILSVGTIEFRKNHITLLNAYRYILEKNDFEPPTLLLVGRNGWLSQDVEFQVNTDPLLIGRVVVVNNIDDKELSYLYQHCLFTVYPSIYEGWGLPVAESLNYGKFCLSSPKASLPEVGGKLVEYLDPLRVDKWAEAIEFYCEQRDVLTEATSKIKTGFVVTRWEDTANMVWNLLQQRYEGGIK